MTDLYERLGSTASAIADATGFETHDIAVVLGSGMGGYTDRFPDAVRVPYEEIGFPVPSAVGHAGAVYSVGIGDRRVLLLSGRVHSYEGHDMDTVTYLVRSAVLSGCSRVVITNAAGGLGEGIEPGDLVLITDHINLAGVSPLAGPNDERLGPRFPDMTEVYSSRLRALAHEAGGRAEVNLKEGVYLWWHGPMYETPAEIRMAATLGADLVGMSTVPEATAAVHMGAEVLGISLCTNYAAGLSGHELSSDEVIAVAAQTSDRFGRLLDQLLPTL